jgi:hypothetical protein
MRTIAVGVRTRERASWRAAAHQRQAQKQFCVMVQRQTGCPWMQMGLTS